MPSTTEHATTTHEVDAKPHSHVATPEPLNDLEGGVAGRVFGGTSGEPPADNASHILGSPSLSHAANSAVRIVALKRAQQSYGNRFVQRVVSGTHLSRPSQDSDEASRKDASDSVTIHPKLAISQPNDPTEQEADQIANQVMRMPEQNSAALCVACAAGGAPCSACGGAPTIQRHSQASGGGMAISGNPLQHLGSGQPLDQSTRDFFEPRLGSDLSDVRIHTGQAAANSAESIQAKAYTLGSSIVFGAGEYAPRRQDGQRLIAHELAHVVTGGEERVRRQPAPAGSVPVPFVGQPDAVAEVREAMAEVNPVAGVGNFPKAFSILASLNMHDLLWTLNSLEQGDKDLLLWSIGSARNFNPARLKAAFAIVDLAHAPTEVTGDDAVLRLGADLSGDDQIGIIDFVTTLMYLRPGHEATARAEASKYKPTGTSRQDIIQQLGLIQRNLVTLDKDARLLGVETRLEPVQNAIDQRLQKLRTSNNAAEVMNWSVQIAGQLDIVRRSALGVSFAKEQLEGAAKPSGSMADVPTYVSEPLMRMANAYVLAARASELLSGGYEKLALADQLAKTLQIQILEETVRHSVKLLDEAKATSHGVTNYTTYSRSLEKLHLDNLARIRELIDSDPEKAAELLKQQQQTVADMHEMAVVVNARVQFDALIESMGEMMGQCADHDFPMDFEELYNLRFDLRKYRDHWNKLESAYFPDDKAAKEAGWKVVRGEGGRLAVLLTQIKNSMERVASKIHWADFLFRIFVVALIAVATMGAGIFLTGVAAGMELGTAGTFLLVSGGEALFFTAATTLLLEKDPSLGKFLQQFLINWVTFGAMRGVSALYRGVLGSAAKTLPGVVGEALLMLGSQSILSLTLADREKRRLTGQGLTDSEAGEIVAEGVVISVITMIGGRVGKDLLPEIATSGLKAGKRIAAINSMRRSLASRCGEIIGKPPSEITSPVIQPQLPIGEATTKPRTGKSMEAAQNVLEEDALLIKQEAEALKEVDLEVAKDPTSPEAQKVKTEITANEKAAEQNEALQIVSVLETAGPNEMLCEQGRLGQVEAYHRKNDKVTVTSGTDADGARNITIIPKDPADGAPLKITEKTTPGAELVITKAPEPMNANEPLPVESKFKTFADLLTEDGQSFKDAKLEEAYQKYKARKAREKKTEKSREEWARSQTSGDYRKPLEADLGPDFFKQGKAKINVRDKPRPLEYTPDRYLADEAAVRPHINKVLRAAGVDPKEGIPGGEISSSAFSGAKGVVTEILAREVQADVLAQVRIDHPNAVIMRGLRIQTMENGVPSAPKQFTDAVIGYFEGDNLILVGRFEVKSGPTGGQEATVQFFEWVERRIERGSVLLVPGKKPVVYGPFPSQRAAGLGTVSGLMNAKTYIIAPEGAEHLGRGSEMQTVTQHERIALPNTATEIEFVTRLLLEPYITPKSTAITTGSVPK